ncbi:MAG: acyl-CoA thioesterase [Gemmatimonadaceae bacterium]|nr:acyl-CoA thioesterase [Gemmatimonadaceae bacterium]
MRESPFNCAQMPEDRVTSFTTTRVLRFGDCDPSGIAYFPAYFNHLVGVVEEFFASVGAPWPELFARQRVGTPTVKLDVTFGAPGFHGDRLDWSVSVARVGRSSLTLEHRIARDDTELWRATQVLVATSLDNHRSIPWPDAVRNGLTRFQDSHRA